MQFHMYQKKKFRVTSTKRKVAGINELNAKVTILKKIKISFIHHLCVNKLV